MMLILCFFMLAAVFAAILRGMPVMLALSGIPLAFAGIGVLVGAFDAALLKAIPERLLGVIGNPVLFAVPLFVLMGKLLEHSGLAEKLFSPRPFAGGRTWLFLVAGLTGLVLVLSASTAIVGASIAILASIAFPALLRAGLKPGEVSAYVSATGALGQLMPPSIMLILLADQISSAWLRSRHSAGDFAADPVTPGHLFAAAILPAVLVAVLIALHLLFRITRTERGETPVSEELPQGGKVGPALMVVAILVAVPVSIITGVATTAEAAAVGATLMFIAFLAAGCGREQLATALHEAVLLTGAIFGIIFGATILALVVRGFDGDLWVSEFLQTVPGDAMGAVLLVMLAVFAFGFIMEFVEIVYIVVPIAAPVLFQLGVDPVWLSVLLALNLQISFLTPPMGIALFYVQSVRPVEGRELHRAVVPYVLLLLLAVALVFVFPAIATTLPAILI